MLFLLFLIQRTGLLMFGYSHIGHPSFDETASGVLACDLLDGELRAPLTVYQYERRSGDGLIEGVLLVPFFSLFGRSLFSLKLLALTSAALTLLCWIAVLKRYHSVWTAIIFTALFALPPLLFARLNLLGTIASHHLINPLMAVQIFMLFFLMEDRKNGICPWVWVGIGIIAGLGTYTFYTYIIFNLFCMLFLVLFRSPVITVPRLLFFGGGFLVGFSPWIAVTLFSGGGGSYLVSILKNIRCDIGVIMQNFVFAIPHSLGYSYPSRGIGVVSPLFCFFIVFLSVLIVRSMLKYLRSLQAVSLTALLQNITPPFLLGIFLVCFPVFYLLCISLSPLEIKPFEYWPSIGFFGYSSPADLYRYRWVHSLFPFYFGLVSVGVVSLFTVNHRYIFYKWGAVSGLVFFLMFSGVKTVILCSWDDASKVLSYKGYSYDQMGNRFMLSSGDEFTLKKAMQFIRCYPEESKAEAYKFLGARVMLQIIDNSDTEHELEKFLRGVSLPYREDVIYGIIWAAQKMPQEVFNPFARYLSQAFPGIFYEMWGFRYLGYKYYLTLLNWEKIRSYIPPVEQWFFRKFLDRFGKNIQNLSEGVVQKRLASEVERTPVSHRVDVVKGIGMRVGAEMFFNPVCSADYPLDSKYGEKFDGVLREAFYEGVGAGFAETLCRAWDTLVLPDRSESPLYTVRLDLEWNRCRLLMLSISPLYAQSVEKGFIERFGQMHLSEGEQHYLQEKYPAFDRWQRSAQS